MLPLTTEDAAQLNLHYQGYTIDSSKGPHLATNELVAKCHTEKLPSGNVAHLYYDLAADHVYVYDVTPG